MATATLTDTDIRVREAARHELERDPGVDASEIGIVARRGVVTLTGFIDTYAGKLAAERAVKLVRGVRAVANDIAVRPKLDRTDPDVARDAVRALESRPAIPATVQVAVHNRHIALTGRVERPNLKHLAENVLLHIPGILGIKNHIEVGPPPHAGDSRTRMIATYDEPDEIC